MQPRSSGVPDRDGNEEVYVMNADGSGQVRDSGSPRAGASYPRRRGSRCAHVSMGS